MAFLISISGAGVTPADTTIDQARNEMTMTSLPAATVADIVALIRLQYEFARTGNGWDAYAAARDPRSDYRFGLHHADLQVATTRRGVQRLCASR